MGTRPGRGRGVFPRGEPRRRSGDPSPRAHLQPVDGVYPRGGAICQRRARPDARAGANQPCHGGAGGRRESAGNVGPPRRHRPRSLLEARTAPASSSASSMPAGRRRQRRGPPARRGRATASWARTRKRIKVRASFTDDRRPRGGADQRGDGASRAAAADCVFPRRAGRARQRGGRVQLRTGVQQKLPGTSGPPALVL